MHFIGTYNAAQNHSSVLTCPTKATNCLPEIWLPRVLFVSYHHWVTYCVLLEDLLRSKYTSPVNHLVNMKIQSKRNKNLQASLTGESSIRGAGDANNKKGYNPPPFLSEEGRSQIVWGHVPSAPPPSGVPVLPNDDIVDMILVVDLYQSWRYWKHRRVKKTFFTTFESTFEEHAHIWGMSMANDFATPEDEVFIDDGERPVTT